MSIVWPCSLSVDAYVGGPGGGVPAAGVPVVFGADGLVVGVSASCPPGGPVPAGVHPPCALPVCGVTHALLPAFLLVGRLDVVETVGAVIEEVAAGGSGCDRRRRGWRFLTPRPGGGGGGSGEGALAAVAFAALAVELAGAVGAGGGPGRVGAGGDGRRVAGGLSLPGWAAVGGWRFVSAVSGGRLIATNTDSPWLIVGRRRFMPPVP